LSQKGKSIKNYAKEDLKTKRNSGK